MNKDKTVLEADDQFEINCRDHLDNMVKMLREMMDSHSIPIKFDELEFEQFVKEYSSAYDRMEIKYENYLKELEREQNEYE